MDMNQVSEHVVDPAIAPVVDANAPQAQEKQLTQSQVNKIVQHEKSKLEEKYQRELAALQQQRTQSDASTSSSAQNPADTEEASYQKMRNRFVAELEENQRQAVQVQREAAARQTVDAYVSKMAQGKDAYADFEEITKEFDPAAFPQLAAFSAQLDNTADIIYELASNPSKLVTLDTLALRNPRQAQAELLKLSKSIAANKEAKSNADKRYTPAPLARLQPSKVSGSNGKLEIRDLRMQPWLKG